MGESVSNSVELKNAGLDERCRRSSIRKESGLLSECEPNVLEVVDVKMRNKKTIQVMFDNEVALENAPKRVVSRRDETDEDAILMLEMLLDGRKMRFQLRNGCLDSFDVSHLKSIRAITVPLCNPCLPNRCSEGGKGPRRVRQFGELSASDFSFCEVTPYSAHQRQRTADTGAGCHRLFPNPLDLHLAAPALP